jgi:myo-inositol-1-phosphate synthase
MAPQVNGNYPDGDVPPVPEVTPAPVHPTAARRLVPVVVNSPTSHFSDECITSKYEYCGASVVSSLGRIEVTPTVQNFEFRTDRKVSKTGCVESYCNIVTCLLVLCHD